MTLPGQEDGLLFQKKIFEDLTEPMLMKILHGNGLVATFNGLRLHDNGHRINQFLYQPNYKPLVTIYFDNLSNQKIWKCSCGGSAFPYHSCVHLNALGITANAWSTVLTQEEYSKILGIACSTQSGSSIYSEIYNFVQPLKELRGTASKLTEHVKNFRQRLDLDSFTRCIGCQQKLPVNSGHCPNCGIINAEYDSKLQETGDSVGCNVDQMIFPSDDPEPQPYSENPISYPSNIFTSPESDVFTCESCGLEFIGYCNITYNSKHQIIKVCSNCHGSNKDGFLGNGIPILGGGLGLGKFPQDLGLPGLEGETQIEFSDGTKQEIKGKVKFTFRDWDDKFENKPKQKKDKIPKIKGKRVFANKDEDV